MTNNEPAMSRDEPRWANNEPAMIQKLPKWAKVYQPWLKNTRNDQHKPTMMKMNQDEPQLRQAWSTIVPIMPRDEPQWTKHD